jgi:hypothetical protein
MDGGDGGYIFEELSDFDFFFKCVLQTNRETGFLCFPRSYRLSPIGAVVPPGGMSFIKLKPEAPHQQFFGDGRERACASQITRPCL